MSVSLQVNPERENLKEMMQEEYRNATAKLFARMVDPERHRKVVNTDSLNAPFFIAQGSQEVPVVTYAMENKNADLQLEHDTEVLLSWKSKDLKTGSQFTWKDNLISLFLDKMAGVRQVIGYLTSAERDKGERVSFSVEPMFPANLNKAPSSMYSTLPTVLTKPHVANHRFDASPLNSIQPIIAGNQIGKNLERPNLLLCSSSHHGYFQDMQPEERSRNFARVSSIDTSYFNQNNMSSIVGNGLPVPFFQAVNSNFNIPAQFSLENLARESNNKKGEAKRFQGEATLSQNSL
ncbi:hypothetical protein DKX38_004566 [Salix brachista]|uniref:Uncharacterized protein n=1 Tax=Salix brachista TaxID=2182728 RepID=A0A5N5NBK0_9ROSI|nr:hypothetical protein DKX38_004566 [Salix brachista]